MAYPMKPEIITAMDQLLASIELRSQKLDQQFRSMEPHFQTILRILEAANDDEDDDDESNSIGGDEEATNDLVKLVDGDGDDCHTDSAAKEDLGDLVGVMLIVEMEARGVATLEEKWSPSTLGLIPIQIRQALIGSIEILFRSDLNQIREQATGSSMTLNNDERGIDVSVMTSFQPATKLEVWEKPPPWPPPSTTATKLKNGIETEYRWNSRGKQNDAVELGAAYERDGKPQWSGPAVGGGGDSSSAACSKASADENIDFQ